MIATHPETITVGQLHSALLAEAKPLHAHFLPALFADLDPSSPLDMSQLERILTQGEIHRRRITAMHDRCAPYQVAYQGIVVRMLRLSAPMLAKVCAALSPAQRCDVLAPIAIFALGLDALELHRLMPLAHAANAQPFSRNRGRRPLHQLEALLGLPGLLTTRNENYALPAGSDAAMLCWALSRPERRSRSGSAYQ